MHAQSHQRILAPGCCCHLQQAALNYKAAHELETEESRAQPNPYARLNQLTLEMLGGDGSERERLLVGVREAEGWANLLKEDDPADVWLWVQVRAMVNTILIKNSPANLPLHTHSDHTHPLVHNLLHF